MSGTPGSSSLCTQDPHFVSPTKSPDILKMDPLRNNHEEDSPCAEEEEEVDPRIQGELEKLNQSTDDINRWESELEDCRQRFRAVLAEATVKLDEQVKRIGRAVDDSKPYWEARKIARQAQIEAQKATQEFQRAVEILRAAKETIALAEERLLEEDSRQFDSAWQEMLNHATQRVMEAEQARTRSEAEHRKTAANYNSCMGHMRQLEKKLKRSINKSRPYFELKAKYYLQLEQLKRHVDERQGKLVVAKADYRTALRNLEGWFSDMFTEQRLKMKLIFLSRKCMMSTTAPTAMPRAVPSTTFRNSFSVVGSTITQTGRTHTGTKKPKTTAYPSAVAKVTLEAARGLLLILKSSTKKVVKLWL